MTPTTIAPFAAASAPVTLGSPGALLRVVLALLIVLGAVFTAAWLSRRLRGFGPARGHDLELLAQLPLGPRERAVLIRVGEQQLLLGVAQGSVSKLHVLKDASVRAGAPLSEAAPASAQRPTFRALLMKSLGR
jgi:flagellar protein FliO/FliZ